jgi:hypothetical protein
MRKKKKQKIDPRLKSILTRIEECEKNIKHFNNDIFETKLISEKAKKLKDDITQTESSYRRINMSQMLEQNLSYRQKKKEYQEAEEKHKRFNTKNILKQLEIEQKRLLNLNQELEKIQKIIQIEHLQKKLTKPSKIKRKSSTAFFDHKPNYISNNKTNPLEITIKPSWGNIYFSDGYITIIHENRSYKKYISQSKKYLNHIKSYYSFKNVPNLEIVVCGNEICEIKNEEVLFYHIVFLSSAGSSFGNVNYRSVNIDIWKKFTKSYYKKHLPFVFHTRSLKKLCEICNDNSPIFAVPEAVINSNGSKAIHNSFLFPINTKSGNKIIWESVEESKASYIFDNIDESFQDIQNLIDYIRGDTPNKRETLIHSPKLGQELRMKKRLFHTSYLDWEQEIELLKEY